MVLHSNKHQLYLFVVSVLGIDASILLLFIRYETLILKHV